MNPADSELVFPARYDTWLALLLVLLPLGLVIGGLVSLGSDPAGGWILVGTGLFVGLIFAIVAYPCRYTIGEEELRIRCGVFLSRVPLSRIRSASPSRNPLSAPAPSLRRVRIDLDKGFQLVAPRERERFIEELKRAAGIDSPAAPAHGS